MKDNPSYIFEFRRSGGHFLVESIKHNFKLDGDIFIEHNHPCRYPNFMKNAPMLFYLQRNIYDVLRSLYGDMWAGKRKPSHFKDWLRMGFVKAWMEHIDQWSKVSNVYHITYEDLNENHIETIRQLEEHFKLRRKYARIKRIKAYVGVSPQSRNKAPDYDNDDINYIKQVLAKWQQ